MKFLVLWHIENTRLTAEIISAVLDQPKYGKKLEAQGKLECRYHVVGSHGGAWIYKRLDRVTPPESPRSGRRLVAHGASRGSWNGKVLLALEGRRPA